MHIVATLVAPLARRE